MTLNPRAHQLASQVKEEGKVTPAKPELVVQPAKPPALKWLHGWVEYHPREFDRRRNRLGMSNLDMSILHEQTLRAGSGRHGYKGFLNWVETQANYGGDFKTQVDTPIQGWMFPLGLGCALLIVGVIGGQLYANRCQNDRKSVDNPELVKYWHYPWNRQTVIEREQGRRGPRSPRELNDSRQHELEPGSEGDLWFEASPERTVLRPGMRGYRAPVTKGDRARIIKGDRSPIRTDLSGQESQTEGQKIVRRS